MIYQPRDYQTLLRDFMLNHERGNAWAGMGLGKSVTSLDSFDTLRMFGEVNRALIIGPKRVAKNAWPAELRKWRESFPHLTMAACIGNPDERKAALGQQAMITTINYENLEWLCEGYGDRFPFDMVYADESTRLKGLRIAVINAGMANEHTRGQGSVRAKAIHRLAHSHVRRWINLTASPAPNGYVDLWGQMWFVDAGQRLGTSFTAFQNRWFDRIQNRDGYTMLVPKQYAPREIEPMLKDCSITIASEDYFPVEKVIESQIMVELPPKARKAYLTMEKQFFAEIRENRIDAFTAGAKAQKLMQIANGTVWIDSNSDHFEDLHDAKLEALGSVLEEANGEPVLVRYTHIPDKIRILKRFPRLKYFDDKQSTEDAWNQGELPGLVTHAKSTGHGLSLQAGGRILCDYSQDYDLEQDEQIIERIGPVRQAQSGLKRSVYRRRLIAADTIEEHSIMPRLKLKMSVQDSLKLAMKVRA